MRKKEVGINIIYIKPAILVFTDYLKNGWNNFYETWSYTKFEHEKNYLARSQIRENLF